MYTFSQKYRVVSTVSGSDYDSTICTTSGEHYWHQCTSAAGTEKESGRANPNLECCLSQFRISCQMVALQLGSKQTKFLPRIRVCSRQHDRHHHTNAALCQRATAEANRHPDRSLGAYSRCQAALDPSSVAPRMHLLI